MLVLSRAAIAAILLLPLAASKKALRPVMARWKLVVVFSIVEIIVPWYFLSAAEQRLPSSTAGLLLAAVPLAAVGIAFVMGRKDRLSGGNWLGILIGTAGVGAIVGLDVAGSDLISVAQLGVVVIGYALGPAILSRWMSDLPGVGVMAISLALSAVVYMPIVFLSGGWPSDMPSAPVLGSIAVLGVLCSAIAFLILFALIGEIGPIRSTAITYVNPAVAVLAGVLILNEQITIWTMVGFALILVGSYLVTKPDIAATSPVPAPLTQTT